MDAIPVDALPDWITTSREYLFEEVEQALRNRELPLEAMRWDITPTGLHYLLLHYDLPAIDVTTWSLEIEGAVDRPMRLDLAALQSLYTVRETVTLECAGNGRGFLHPRPIGQPWLTGGVSTATWTGTPLWPLLEAAGLHDEALEIVFTGLDRGIDAGREARFERSLTIEASRTTGALLAWAMNDEPLPIQHGAPLRLVVPGWYGMASVKWLCRLTVVTAPFTGYQQAEAYRYFQPGTDDAPPVDRILPRAVLIPVGLPDGDTGARTVRRGEVAVEGRAWSGFAQIERVEVDLGDGDWRTAALAPVIGPNAWRRFHVDWDARAGTWTLRARAIDAAGNEQPLEQRWNLDGYGNNAVRPLTVTVVDG
jgi:sulfane dehydrogenase subunit SoxC